MSADTESNGVDPSTEIEGFHDRLRRAYELSHEESVESWDEVADILSGAKSRALRRKDELVREEFGDE